MVEGLGLRARFRALPAQRTSPPTCSYFSLLRPFSELAVARQFARIDRYDAHFSSCNRNFHLLGERPAQRWCGACPKCHFVFLALAPFMPKPRLMGIFGRNLLDEPEQAPGFDALLEYQRPQALRMRGRGPRVARRAWRRWRTRPPGARMRWWRASPREIRAAAHGMRNCAGAAARSHPMITAFQPRSGDRCLKISELEGKRVAIWGYGREGRAALAALALAPAAAGA